MSTDADNTLDTKLLRLKQASGNDVSIELRYGEVLNISEDYHDFDGVMADGGIKTISLNIQQAKKLCEFLNYAIE